MTFIGMWTDAQNARLALLLAEPIPIKPMAMAAILNSECGGNFNDRHVRQKIYRLHARALAPAPILAWPAKVVDRAIELHDGGKGPSCSTIADTLNREFHAFYTRNAVIGKLHRLGAAPRDPNAATAPRKPRAKLEYQPRPKPFRQPIPTLPPELVKLRCVELDPRHLTLLDLEPDDCRYPYGGDAVDEPITFCGHPKMPGQSWCVPHFHLCRGVGTVSERRANRERAA